MIAAVRLEGFQSHVDTTLEFVPGVNVLIGESDTGKTSALRALRWAFFNRPSGESFVHSGTAKNKKLPCRVTTVTTTNDVVVRERKPKNRYTVNGTEFTTVGRTVPDEVRAVLNVQPINDQGQLVDQYFLVLDSPGEISRYLSDLFRFEASEQAASRLKERAQSAGKTHEALVRDRQLLDTALTQFATLPQYAAPISTLEESLVELGETQRRAGALRHLLDRLQRATEDASRAAKIATLDLHQVDQYAQLLGATQVQRATLVTRLEGVQRAQQQLLTKQHVVEHAAGVVHQEIQQYTGALRAMKSCPVCFRPMSEDVVAQAVQGVAA